MVRGRRRKVEPGLRLLTEHGVKSAAATTAVD
jgi:hypothetical protein